MLGRFQPFHDGHFELFKKILEKTGQVVILVRVCKGENNPYNFGTVKRKIIKINIWSFEKANHKLCMYTPL